MHSIYFIHGKYPIIVYTLSDQLIKTLPGYWA